MVVHKKIQTQRESARVRSHACMRVAASVDTSVLSYLTEKKTDYLTYESCEMMTHLTLFPVHKSFYLILRLPNHHHPSTTMNLGICIELNSNKLNKSL